MLDNLTEYESELVIDSLHTYAAECRKTPGCDRLARDVEVLRLRWVRQHRLRFPLPPRFHWAADLWVQTHLEQALRQLTATTPERTTMGNKTGIEWTDRTWNPTTGCDRISPGCDHCYAVPQANRMQETPAYAGTVQLTEKGLDWTGRVNLNVDRLDQPLRWQKPALVFVDSMSDLFHKDVPVNFIVEVFAVMARADRHIFQTLTKRTRRMAVVLSDPSFRERVEQTIARDGGPHAAAKFRWPIPNVWIGTSIESDRYSFRADHLRDTPAAVRWISAEPLLGPLPSLDLVRIDWVVAGGESGKGTGDNAPRPMHPDWVRDLRDRCAWGDAHGHPVAFEFKQWGQWAPAPWKVHQLPGEDVDAYKARAEAEGASIGVQLGGDVHEFSHKPWSVERADHPSPGRAGMRRHKFKSDAGNLLDGQAHDGYPPQAAEAGLR